MSSSGIAGSYDNSVSLIIREMKIQNAMRLSPHTSQNDYHQNIYKQ